RHSTLSVQVERCVSARDFDGRLRKMPVTFDGELHDNAARDLRLLHPAAANAFHHQDEVLGTAEIRHIERRPRPGAATRRQAESLATSGCLRNRASRLYLFSFG